MAASLLLVALTLLLFCIRRCHSSWDEVSNLDTLHPNKVKEFISPLVIISGNAYSYPGDLQPVSNWTLASSLAPKKQQQQQQAGVHALLYKQVQTQEQKLVLAFRGTYTQADSCVDLFLFGEAALPRGMQLPNKDSCNARFDSASLDYLSQAVGYTQSILQTYPGTSLLLTGHSLGAALAILVSASLSKTQVLPVVAFSSPGTRGILEEKSLQLQAEQQNRVFVFGDEWDGVMRTLWKLQVGTVCSVEYDEPPACVACSSSSSSSSSSSIVTDDNNCRQCIFEAHGLNHILQILDDGKSKLVCEKNFSTSSEDPSLRLPEAAPNSGSVLNIGLFSVLVFGAFVCTF